MRDQLACRSKRMDVLYTRRLMDFAYVLVRLCCNSYTHGAFSQGSIATSTWSIHHGNIATRSLDSLVIVRSARLLRCLCL